MTAVLESQGLGKRYGRYETAIFLVLAVALAAFCFWWVSRRRLA